MGFRLVLLASTLFAFCSIPAVNAEGDRLEVLDAWLPTPRSGTAAVWTGHEAYIFGGQDSGGRLDDIVRFRPPDMAERIGVRLPSPRGSLAAVWTGKEAFIFGSYGGQSDWIFRFDPVANTAQAVRTTPAVMDRLAAVWTGEAAYVFGGFNGVTSLNTILRFDPSSGNVEVMTATLPTPRHRMAGVWDGQAVYLFGGEDSTGPLDEILRYDPDTDEIQIVSRHLPEPKQGLAAVWTGTEALIVGGGPGSTSIVAFSPRDGRVVVMESRLNRLYGSAVWAGDAAFIFGGTGRDFTDEIVRFDPSPNGASVSDDRSARAPIRLPIPGPPAAVVLLAAAVALCLRTKRPIATQR